MTTDASADSIDAWDSKRQGEACHSGLRPGIHADIHDKFCQGELKIPRFPTADVVPPDLRAGVAFYFFAPKGRWANHDQTSIRGIGRVATPLPKFKSGR